MKTKLIFLFVSLSSLVFGQNGSVQLTIKGIQVNKGGVISVGLFTEKNFPTVGKHTFRIEQKVEAETIVLTYKDIPAGEYGVAAFQDVNLNEKLDANFLGFPKEPIGFSNDAKIVLAPPKFSDAKVEVKLGQQLNLGITLK